MLVRHRHDATQIRGEVDVARRLTVGVGHQLALDLRGAAPMNQALTQIGEIRRVAKEVAQGLAVIAASASWPREQFQKLLKSARPT